jgi:hypothetical protein
MAHRAEQYGLASALPPSNRLPDASRADYHHHVLDHGPCTFKGSIRLDVAAELSRKRSVLRTKRCELIFYQDGAAFKRLYVDEAKVCLLP